MNLPRRAVIAGVAILLGGATGASVSSATPVSAFVTTLVAGALVAAAILGIYLLVRRAVSRPSARGPEQD
jgi:hypothetical protein